MTNIERLRTRFETLKADGLLDLKVWFIAWEPTSDATLESLAGEMLDVLDAIERRDFVNTPEQRAKFA